MDTQFEQAVQIAASPTNPELAQQALKYIHDVRDSADGWQTCLQLFVRSSPPASDTVRFVSLDIILAAINARINNPADESLQYIKQVLFDYIQKSYGPGSSSTDAGNIQNKLSQALTGLFVATYVTNWPSFFDDLMALGKNTPGGAWDNFIGIEFFIRTSASIHDEVADTMIPRTPQEANRNVYIKDCVRERDMTKLVTAWQEILEEFKGKSEPLVELGLRVIARWVSWIDISLVVNEVMMRQLFYFMDCGGKVRDAALHALTEIVGKKMKGPDKLDLINFLNVGDIVGQICQSAPLRDQNTMEYDTDLAEGTAKLVNTAATDIVLILKDETQYDQNTKQRADTMLQSFMPLILRFFQDQYDEVSAAVFPVTNELLALFRKEKKATNVLSDSHQQMLPLILNAIIMKTKYDSETEWGDEDEQTDEAEFEELRRKLKTMQDAVSVIDEPLYIECISQLVETTFGRVAENASVDWHELDLALYQVFTFGELVQKYGGIWTKGKPSCPAAEKLVNMLGKLMNCNVAGFSHPAIRLKSMEIFVRYPAFFEVHTSLIPQALESFVKCIHDSHPRVKARSWYQFLRFVKHLRQHMGEITETILGAMSDLLVIHAELPAVTEEEDMSSDSGKNEDATFDTQLHLFETVGVLSAAPGLPIDKQKAFITSVLEPLFADIQAHLGAAENGDARAVLQIHHNIMALGTVGKGYSDWGSNVKITTPPPEIVVKEFVRATEAILIALDRLSKFSPIREASRFSFTRMVGVLGPEILPYLPRWISGLMVESSSKGEISMFLKLLEQIVHSFKNVVYDILNQLFTPLLTRILSSLDTTTSGTDEEVELSELRRSFLNFILVIMANDLGAVLVSSTNQAHFEPILKATTHYARLVSDPTTAKSALLTLNKMCYIFGPSTPHAPTKYAITLGANPPKEQPLSGFEGIMTSQIGMLCWEIVCTKAISPKDAQGKLVLGEVANLQKMLYVKLGDECLHNMRAEVFPMIGVTRGIEEYCQAMQNLEGKELKVFFQKFIQEVIQ